MNKKIEARKIARDFDFLPCCTYADASIAPIPPGCIIKMIRSRNIVLSPPLIKEPSIKSMNKRSMGKLL